MIKETDMIQKRNDPRIKIARMKDIRISIAPATYTVLREITFFLCGLSLHDTGLS